MINSLLRSKPSRRRFQRARRSSSQYFQPDHAGAQGPSPGWRDPSDEHGDAVDDALDDEEDESDDEGPGENAPLLPIFSAAHLDSLPVYNITHAARLLIIQRCETTLSWDQLRSPQVSQFMVKPIQQQIRAAHFSRATVYALIANCLQFQKEAQNNPANVGISKTRALISELLAIRLLKEYTTRELIDALSYDFDPLQGMSPQATGQFGRGRSMPPQSTRNPSLARTSTLEVAIRAQAKKFLAHPVVVQQLEAIWAGTIVFHSAADSLHRYPVKPRLNPARHYGATHETTHDENANRPSGSSPLVPSGEPIRRSVTLYNPQDASLFKLSRLRVPRYRQIFSTLSYAIMLGLFLAILIQRSLDITSLEVIFWFWSVGFMLDEIVCFSEQGFGLYIMSVWNAFDIGILMLFFTYYLLRLYGIVIVDDEKHHIANMAYDTLASSAVLLFPRLFSLLDHYRYFSQLLIGFRLMAQDLVAVLILIAISCSGFFVAFTLSFREDFNANNVVYALFQILMGFTPAAWDAWETYNALGKVILTLFLIICHFLVVTILITVLTNSFMAVAQNANEEHQFLFAVNTISMVKSDALFSYIAPTNIAGWLFSPLRYVIPFRQYVKINRSIIKATHFPVLFVIFAYERLVLSRYAYGSTDLVDQGPASGRIPAFALNGATDIFSPGRRLREPSVTTFHKDRALEEVFRRPYRDSTILRQHSGADRTKANVVDSWMKGMASEGGASPPVEEAMSITAQIPARRIRLQRSMTSYQFGLSARHASAAKSTTSDPATRSRRRRPRRAEESSDLLTESVDEQPQPTDADGDDELFSNGYETLTNPEGLNSSPLNGSDKENQVKGGKPPLYSPTPKPATSFSAEFGATAATASPSASPWAKAIGHNRQSSTATILFKPLAGEPERVAASEKASAPSRTPAESSKAALLEPLAERRTPKRTQRGQAAKSRPSIPPRDAYKSVPNIAQFFDNNRERRRMPSMETAALDLASDIGDNRFRPSFDVVGAMPASFQTQMAYAQAGMRERRREREKQDDELVGRIVLARMNTLEEGFKDILKEVKEWRNAGSQATSAGEELKPERAMKRLEKKEKKRQEKLEVRPPEAEGEPPQEQQASEEQSDAKIGGSGLG